MYKFLASIAIASILLTAFAPSKSTEVTLVNRSGFPLAIQLLGEDQVDGQNYFFNLPKGDRDNPSSRTFEIARDRYQLIVTYIESYDPVYGYRCQSKGYFIYSIKAKTKIYFYPCGQIPPNPGAPNQFKAGIWPKLHRGQWLLPPPVPEN